jgi:hypothetical protein
MTIFDQTLDIIRADDQLGTFQGSDLLPSRVVPVLPITVAEFFA